MIRPATSSTQPNKADCSKCVICQDNVENSMLCVKTKDCGLNTILENRIHFINGFRKCIAFLNLWLLDEMEKGQKETYLFYYRFYRIFY